ALADVVILESLARSDAQRAIAYFIREPIEFQVLLRVKPPTRNYHADHGAECPLRLQLSQVTIVLLVDAMKLQHACRWIREIWKRVIQFLSNRAAEMPAVALQNLRAGKPRFSRHRRPPCRREDATPGHRAARAPAIS